VTTNARVPAEGAPRRGDGPRPTRSFRGERAVKVAARSVHIAAMGVVLGGVVLAVPEQALMTAISVTVASGLTLFGVDLWKEAAYLTQGNGVAVLLKLALLGLGLVLPDARPACYLSATLVASVGSHMPRAWRHWSFFYCRVLD
jgi:hypothetical protein